MNTRQRFPANGYRSHVISSGISPESSLRSHPNFSHSDSHNFHRPFGRMHPKSPLPMPHQSSRRGNLFIEAGRLAVDYLIFHGLLPPDVLSTTSSNGNLKINDNLEFNLNHHELAEGISHMEDLSTAPTSSEKSDDAYETGKRFPVDAKEKRRLPRPPSSTALRDENVTAGSLPTKASPAADVIDNGNNAHIQQNAKEVDTNIANSIDETGKRFPVDVEEKRRLPRPPSSTALSDENVSAGSFSNKAIPPVDVIDNGNNAHIQQNAKEVDPNIANSIDDGAWFKQCQDEISENCLKDNGASVVDDASQNTEKLSSVNVELEVGKQSNGSDLGEKDADEKSTTDYSEGGTDTYRKDCDDLLKSCNYELSTKSLCNFRPADMNVLMLSDGSNNICQSGSAAQLIMPVNKNLTSALSGFSDFELSSRMDKARGEKRSLENEDTNGNTKKVKDCTSDLHKEDSKKSDCIGSHELLPIPGSAAIQAVNQESVSTGSMSLKGGIGPSVGYSEEKQFFPGSFKICDLNLIEVSDANETHDDPKVAHSSYPVLEKDISADNDLSMSNSCSLNNMCSKYEVPGKGVQIIDLETDSLQGDKGIQNSAERMQSEFPGLESFPNHLQNSTENPDMQLQDGYGLILSEFIGTDIQNCSSVQPGVSSLQNEIGLHHGEGILSDDDQIYMSLGEIPLSLLRSWDQPPQDYDKPF